MIDLSFLSPRNLAIWLTAWTLIGIIVMGEDKDQAVVQSGLSHVERISERTIHEVALVGGFLGIIIGAKLFHHKVSKPSFWPTVIFAAPIWIAIVFYTLFGHPLTINPIKSATYWITP